MSSLSESYPNLSFDLADTADADLRRALHEALKSFNNEMSPAHKRARVTGVQPLDIFVHDARGALVGGLTSGTYWDWLDIEDLWLHEDWRRGGLGSQLLAAAEQEARRRGCRRAKLETFSFQARGFYEKQGYRVCGRLDEYPPGESFFWMTKELIAES